MVRPFSGNSKCLTNLIHRNIWINNSKIIHYSKEISMLLWLFFLEVLMFDTHVWNLGKIKHTRIWHSHLNSSKSNMGDDCSIQGLFFFFWGGRGTRSLIDQWVNFLFAKLQQLNTWKTWRTLIHQCFNPSKNLSCLIIH